MIKLYKSLFILSIVLLINSCGGETKYARIDLVTQMHNHWKGKWYMYAIIERNVKIYAKGVVIKKNKLNQAISFPNLMCIKVNGFESGNGSIFNNDTSYIYRKNNLIKKERILHTLNLMTISIFFQPPDSTKQKLTELGCDYMISHQTKWKDRNVYVMGAINEDDTTSMQFWLDKENMYLVKIMSKEKNISKEIHLNNYKQIDNYWFPEEIIFFNNGEKKVKHKITNVSFPDTIDITTFDPQNFNNSKW